MADAVRFATSNLNTWNALVVVTNGLRSPDRDRRRVMETKLMAHF